MKRWLKVLLTADFFALLAIGMITPIYAIFVEEIGGDILDASGAWALFAITSGILMYLIGKWEDRGKHYAGMLFFGYLLRSFAFLGYFFVQNTMQLFGVQIILGLSVAVTNPSYDALYSKCLQKGKYAAQWGAWEAMNMIVEAVAALIGGAIASYFGFKALFAVMFLSGIIGVGVSSVLITRKPAKLTAKPIR
ncbi:MFS transporter [Candidatus Woesearchaeota archaeon]|nr:MFS transporter [Candidatus Woesearchaeota archaeon]